MNVRCIIICCLLFVSVSCDDYLNVNPKGEVINDQMFSTPEGFEDALYGCYSSLTSSSLYGKDLAWYMLGIQAQFFDVTKSMKAYYKASIYEYDTEFQSEVKSVWRGLYKSIGYTNNILAQLEKYSDKDFGLYNLYKGEALALRAFLHHELVKLFAEHIERGTDTKGIPYVKTYSYGVKAFSTVGEVYGEILKDLLEAEKLMEKDKEYVVYPRNKEIGSDFNSQRQIHINIYAVQALMARVYWHKGEMDNALSYAEKVINSGKFQLIEKSEINDFIAGCLSEKETIWGLFSDTYAETTRTYLYDEISHKSIQIYGDNGYMPESYVALYEYDKDANSGTDLRYNNHFRKTEDGSNIRCLKVCDYVYIEDSRTSLSRGKIPGINMIRLPEMYYIAAEALLKTDADKARRYFDMVIETRGLIPFENRQPAKALTLENINNERRKEFYCEGREWYNMKRQLRDIKSNAEGRTIEANSDLYIWPIPNEEFEYRNDK